MSSESIEGVGLTFGEKPVARKHVMGVISVTHYRGRAHAQSENADRHYRVVSRGTCNMRQSEGIPLWDSVTQPFANLLDFAFGCRHRKLSRVFTIDNHSYQVCFECGATFNYSLETMSVGHRRKHLSALRQL
jgi:hypothetical protein